MKKTLALLALLLMPFTLFAEEAAQSTRSTSSFWQTLIMIGIAILFFYFILWRPEQRRRKDIEKKRNEIKKGDQVTAMGIVGTVDRIKETTIIIKNVDGSKIEVLKAAINEVKPFTAQVEKEPKEEPVS